VSMRTELEQFAAGVEAALAVPTSGTDSESRGYDQACRDTLTRVRQILEASDES